MPPTTPTKRRQTKSFPVSHVKAVDLEAGTFEAVVAVFGNVDHHGDRIVPGAFAASLERWEAAGDPVPVIFSHQWHDLAAYLGTADPSDIRELEAGDPDLPEPIRDLGGLHVRGTIDTEEPEGRKALKLLKNRVVREFSFAYDIDEDGRGEDGRHELRALDLIELGPTLKGANPLTQLVAAKSAALEAAAGTLGVDPSDLAAALEAAAGDLPAGDTDADGGPASDETTKAGPRRRSKAWVTPAGTIERFVESVRVAVIDSALERFGDELYAVDVEGTFDDRVVFYLETWADPVGGGVFYEAAFTVDGDTVTVGEWQAVELELAVTPLGGDPGAVDEDGVTDEAKARHRLGFKAGARNAAADLARIQSAHDLLAELGAACDGTTDDDPEGEDDGDPDGASSRTIPAPGVILASIETELLDL